MVPYKFLNVCFISVRYVIGILIGSGSFFRRKPHHLEFVKIGWKADDSYDCITNCQNVKVFDLHVEIYDFIVLEDKSSYSCIHAPNNIMYHYSCYLLNKFPWEEAEYRIFFLITFYKSPLEWI